MRGPVGPRERSSAPVGERGGRNDSRPRRAGRRGLRTSVMVTVARDRMELLFRRAEEASAERAPERADRYVEMARRIGTRYNVRMSPAMRARFCRGCLSYFREGVNVRTRLRAGRRVRTCLKCQRSARVPIRLSAPAWEPASSRPPGGLVEPIAVPLDELAEEDEDVGEPIDEA